MEPAPPAAGRLHLGTAVWAFRGWVGSFYPPDTPPQDMLRLYTERLTAVEGNVTFYATPPAETLRAWASEMPEGFRFCPKLSRDITHAEALAPGLPAARAFLAAMQPLRERAGPVFAQLPPGFGPERRADLEQFLAGWPRHDWPLQLEVRHRGWFAPPQREALDALLRSLGVGRVMLDTRPIYDGPDDPQVHSERKKPELPLWPEPTTRTVMVRYIGHPTPERNDAWLAEWIPRVDGWLRQGLDVLFFAHCPMEERSPELARRLHAGLVARGAPVAPLPWDRVRSRAPQLDLFG